VRPNLQHLPHHLWVWPKWAFPEQLPAKLTPHHTRRGKRSSTAACWWLAAPTRARPWRAHGRVRQHQSSTPCRGGYTRRLHGTQAKAKSMKFSKSAFFARERKTKPPVSEPHHFHLPFNQPLPASPAARPSRVQAVILFLSQKQGCSLACWIWQFIKQIRSLA